MRKPLSFLDFTELSGHWFLPQQEGRRCAGRLVFSKTDFSLHLLERLESGGTSVGQSDDRVPVVFGCTNKSVAVTLFRSFRGGGGQAWFGSAGEEVHTETFRPHMALVGAYVLDEHQAFTAIRARIPGLLNWLGVSAIQDAEPIRDEAGRSIGLTIAVRPQRSPSVELKHLPGSVTISKLAEQDVGRFDSVTLKSEGWLEIKPLNPLPIRDLLIPMSVQDETKYGMLQVVFNNRSLPWRDHEWWT